MSIALSVLALLVALAALGLHFRRPAGKPVEPVGADLPADALGLRHEVAALREEASAALRHLAVVRYDAYPDMGGALSWSLALLDDHGDGTVITSIHGRSEARTYAKPVAGWQCDQPLSPEESEAVERAKP